MAESGQNGGSAAGKPLTVIERSRTAGNQPVTATVRIRTRKGVAESKVQSCCGLKKAPVSHEVSNARPTDCARLVIDDPLNELSGLADVYLEDSYVLGITESSEKVVFHLDAVLTPDHPAYHPHPAPASNTATRREVWSSLMSPASNGSSGLAPITPTLPAKGIWGTSTSSQWMATSSSRKVIGAQFGSPGHNRASNSVMIEPQRSRGRARVFAVLAAQRAPA